MEEDAHETSPLCSPRRSKSSMSLSCCFIGHRYGRSLDFDASSSSPTIMPNPRTPWTLSRAPDMPETKGKYKHYMSRKGRNRRNSSADFSYDPLSYALNFEEPSEEPIRSFTSRLPISPPKGRGVLISSSVSASASLPASMSWTSSEQQMLSGADAVAEVQKSLEPSTPREELKRRFGDLPTPRRPT